VSSHANLYKKDPNLTYFKFYLASNCGTMVEHSPHLPKVRGSSTVTSVGTGREEKEKVLNCTV
jgi:hypothetical protein